MERRRGKNCAAVTKMWYERNKEKLNELQRAAVEDESRACVVNACVGSGKTTVLAAKICYLHEVKKVPLERMMALTFTNKAAQEIRERLACTEIPTVGTFHSVALYLLKQELPLERIGYGRDFRVIIPEEELELARELIREKGFAVKYKNRLKKRLEQERPGFLEGREKNRLGDELFPLMAAMEEEKRRRGEMTFADLLEKAAYLLRELLSEGQPLTPEWIIIDEAQDVDPSQLAFLEALYGEKTSLFAVGDPNQVIYSWRGGTENMFFRLKNRFQAKELPLSINYRSNGVILEAAGRFRQFGGELAGCRERGERIVVRNHYNPFQEAEYLAGRIRQLHEKGTAYGQTAVFYRLQEQAELLERVFEREGIPFETAGSRSITDIPVLDWLVRLLRAACVRSEELLKDVVSDRRYGIGEPLEERIRGLAGHVSGGQISNGHAFGEHAFAGNVSGGMDGAGAALYAYLLLDRCLRPARAEYREEKELALGFLGRLAEQCAKGGRDFPSEGDCRSEQDFLSEIREFLNGAALCGFSPELKREEGTDRVRLMTLHASKGLEFSQVFLIGVNQGLIPLSGRSFEEKEEERRLFFVGLTRARDRLELSYYTDPAPYRAAGGPGSYLRLLPVSLLDWKEARTQEAAAENLQRLRRAVLEQKRGMKEKEALELPGRIPDTLPGSPPGGEGRAVEKAGKEPEEKSEKNTEESAAENPAENPAGNPAPRRVRHPRYGVGVVSGEDESMIRVEFEGYGSKTFVKAFSGLTEC